MPKSKDSPEVHHSFKIVFFSFFILEYAGGNEYEIMENAAGIMKLFGEADCTIVTASPSSTRRIQYFVSLLLLKLPKDLLYRQPTAKINKLLGPVKYIHFKNLRNLRRLIKNADALYVKNEILELGILKLIGASKLRPIVVKIATPIYYPHAASLSDKLHNLLYTSPLYKLLIKQAKSVKVNGHDDLTYVQEKLGIKNVQIIHNAIKADVQQSTNNDTYLRVLFVGRLTMQKGIDVLIATIEQLLISEQGYQFQFKIAGSGEKGLESKILELSKQFDSVEFVGEVANELVPKLYAWADVTVAPSRYETLNRVVAETAAAGKIVVCTDIPGPRELVEDGVSGFLVALDAQKFVSKIIELASMKQHDRKRFYDIGQAAQNKIRTEFAPRVVYENLYRQLRDAAK